MAPKESNVHYDFDPYDCVPGTGALVFRRNCLNTGAKTVDSRGFSYADHFLGTDEGAPGVGYVGLGGAALAKAQVCYRSRQK